MMRARIGFLMLFLGLACLGVLFVTRWILQLHQLSPWSAYGAAMLSYIMFGTYLVESEISKREQKPPSA